MNRREAKATTVFFINFHGHIETDTLYNLVMRCAERISSPVGNMPRLFITVNEDRFELNEWNHKNKALTIDVFQSREIAEDELFCKVYLWDFLQDEASNYFLTAEEAKQNQ